MAVAAPSRPFLVVALRGSVSALYVASRATRFRGGEIITPDAWRALEHQDRTAADLFNDALTEARQSPCCTWAFDEPRARPGWKPGALLGALGRAVALDPGLRRGADGAGPGARMSAATACKRSAGCERSNNPARRRRRGGLLRCAGGRRASVRRQFLKGRARRPRSLRKRRGGASAIRCVRALRARVRAHRPDPASVTAGQI